MKILNKFYENLNQVIKVKGYPKKLLKTIPR